MATWREFGDGAHSIYVNDRHRDVHYREIAEQIAAHGKLLAELDKASGGKTVWRALVA